MKNFTRPQSDFCPPGSIDIAFLITKSDKGQKIKK